MKKQNIFIIGLILLAVISFIIFILVSGSGNKGNIETAKDINDIINTINKNNKNVLPELETMKVDIKNIDEVTSYTGLKTNDGYRINCCISTIDNSTSLFSCYC